MTDYKNTLTSLIDQNDGALDSVFSDLKINKAFEQQLKQVKIYYRRSFDNSQAKSACLNVIKEYSILIERIQKIKDGRLTVNQAIEELNNDTENKRIEMVIHNIFKACALLFWAASAAFFYVGCFSLGLPLIACEPIIGSLITLGSATFFFNSLVCTVECFEQFKSFDSIDEEETKETHLMSFFNTFKPNQTTRLQVPQNEPDPDFIPNQQELSI